MHNFKIGEGIILYDQTRESETVTVRDLVNLLSRLPLDSKVDVTINGYLGDQWVKVTIAE